MKFRTAAITTLLLALAAYTRPAAAGGPRRTPPTPPKRNPGCHWSRGDLADNGFVPFGRRFYIGVDNIAEDEDVPSLCHNLWANLRQFAASCIVTGMLENFHDQFGPGCEETRVLGVKGLRWVFQTSVACNPGMVQAAWWDVTENRHGELVCYEIDA